MLKDAYPLKIKYCELLHMTLMYPCVCTCVHLCAESKKKKPIYVSLVALKTKYYKSLHMTPMRLWVLSASHTARDRKRHEVCVADLRRAAWSMVSMYALTHLVR